MYSHRAVSGKDMSMLSIRAPGVKRPNLVPRSWTRLNSTYLPRRSCCQHVCSAVYGSSLCFFISGIYEGITAFAALVTNLKQSFCEGVSRSSKKMPPIPRLSPR